MLGRKKKQEIHMHNHPVMSIPGGDQDIMSSLFPPDDTRTDMREIVDKFINADDDDKLLERLSELNQRQILALSILMTAADEYNLVTLDKIVHKYLSLMFSKKRMSRKEIIDLFGKQQQQQPFMLGGDSKVMNKLKG